jgi:hypothetical protein
MKRKNISIIDASLQKPTLSYHCQSLPFLHVTRFVCHTATQARNSVSFPVRLIEALHRSIHESATYRLMSSSLVGSDHSLLACASCGMLLTSSNSAPHQHVTMSRPQPALFALYSNFVSPAGECCICHACFDSILLRFATATPPGSSIVSGADAESTAAGAVVDAAHLSDSSSR